MPLNFRLKLIAWPRLREWRQQLRSAGLTLVATNGCFDILHAGHVGYLESARNHGDLLLVGLNSDRSVQALKGPGRPVNPEADRAMVLAGLESVSGVCIFDDLRATCFLKECSPDVFVKGGDYTVDTIPQEERRVVESAGGKILFLPFLEGRSTSSVLKKIGSNV